ncbi:hypothetical protein EDB86DRAFT_555077 [Lactarius hatsudake]|nr:hypothetical protein EDB86DRAFT_555077 [Lactarius hatsudake]
MRARGERACVDVEGLRARVSAARSGMETVGYRAPLGMRVVANGRTHFGAAQSFAGVAAGVGVTSGSSREGHMQARHAGKCKGRLRVTPSSEVQKLKGKVYCLKLGCRVISGCIPHILCHTFMATGSTRPKPEGPHFSRNCCSAFRDFCLDLA